MTLRDLLENNPVLIVLATLLAGFLAGIGVYKGIIEIANLKVISQSDYERLSRAQLSATASKEDIARWARNYAAIHDHPGVFSGTEKPLQTNRHRYQSMLSSLELDETPDMKISRDHLMDMVRAAPQHDSSSSETMIITDAVSAFYEDVKARIRRYAGDLGVDVVSIERTR